MKYSKDYRHLNLGTLVSSGCERVKEIKRLKSLQKAEAYLELKQASTKELF